ncbi:HAD family hydrolase [Oceanobacillus sojae]|uniref:HAD family hydrolase n=1 Tax=Oceanobacillus sojae TaxID=582851 RepID=UPI0021A33A6F|nr:HAD family hydrolase [Oceanobacillus sojae]MCT1904269.1 HAD family hydrolase [Oceanobacillus sojae]
MLKDYKLVIFDLDGTLYEGTEHFDYYAKLLQEKVAPAYQADYLREYEAMKAGKHLVSIGKVYDAARDLVLTIDSLTFEVSAAYRWNGEKLSETETQEYYPGPQQFDFNHLVAIGDGWWLPFASAKHYGVEENYSSYLATKEFMVSDDFTIEKLEGLRTYLLQLKEKTQIVLLTNSDREDVTRLLNELDLTNIFDHMITSAKKPAYTKKWMEHLIEQYEIESAEAVSVGDNFINEIAPALSLGMDAVYIQPHGHNEERDGLKVIDSLTDFSKQR